MALGLAAALKDNLARGCGLQHATGAPGRPTASSLITELCCTGYGVLAAVDVAALRRRRYSRPTRMLGGFVGP